MAVAGDTDVNIQSGPLPPGPAARARSRLAGLGCAAKPS